MIVFWWGRSRVSNSTLCRRIACFLDLLGRMYMPGSPVNVPSYMLADMVGARSGWRRAEVHRVEKGGPW